MVSGSYNEFKAIAYDVPASFDGLATKTSGCCPAGQVEGLWRALQPAFRRFLPSVGEDVAATSGIVLEVDVDAFVVRHKGSLLSVTTVMVGDSGANT